MGLEAIAEVPTQSEAFIKMVEDSLADQKERDKARKEAKAAQQKEKEVRGDYSGDANATRAEERAEGGEVKANAAAKANADPTRKGSVNKDADDPFGDFDFEEKPKPKAPEPKATPVKSETLVTKKEDERSAIAEAVKQQKRTGWDPNFDHPYAGALKSNGTGVYCRPCQRWIMTYEFNTDVFFTHVERVHPKPPP